MNFRHEWTFSVGANIVLLSQVQEVVQRTFHFPQKQKYLKRSQDVFCDINHVWLNIRQGGSILGWIKSQKKMLQKTFTSKLTRWTPSTFPNCHLFWLFPKQIQPFFREAFLLQHKKNCEEKNSATIATEQSQKVFQCSLSGSRNQFRRNISNGIISSNSLFKPQ